MKITAETVVDRPVTDVFAFCAENHHANHPRWDPQVTRLEPVEPGPPALGATFRMTRRLLGREEVHEFRYVEWVPGTAMAYQSQDGPMQFLIQCTFSPVGSGATRIRLSGEAQLRGPRALIAPLLKPMFERQLDGNLARIKGFVESEP